MQSVCIGALFRSWCLALFLVDRSTNRVFVGSIRLGAALIALSTVLASVGPLHAGTPSFTPLGFLTTEGFSIVSRATGVSADGSVVVGLSESGFGFEAFRWTAGGGMVGLGYPPGKGYSSALGVNADGSVVVGQGATSFSSFFGFAGSEPFRWTDAGGMAGLGLLPDGLDNVGWGVSADGSVVVGGPFDFNAGEAFRWTADGGIEGLGFLPEGFGSSARGVSADGSVVVGQSESPSGIEAFRWTADEGMEGLGFLPGEFGSSARATSADGSVVVGQSGFEAFRWTADGGMVGLGFLPGGFESIANAVSTDGAVAVGSADFLSEAVRFRGNGIKTIEAILIDYGLGSAIDGWQLTEATGISADGRTIVGNGINPLGIEEAWIVTVPEPSAFFLTALGGMGLALAALRRRAKLSGNFPVRRRGDWICSSCPYE